MFPTLNKMFRPKQANEMNTLLIPADRRSLLDAAKNSMDQRITDNKGNTIISDTTQKLNIVGAQFEEAYTQNLGNQSLDNIVKNKINLLKKEIENDNKNKITVTNFNNENPASSPTTQLENKYFTNTLELRGIFKKLPNKKSSSFDKIPHITLKHIPIEMIEQLVIIFNNTLNNKHFPSTWKIAKVIALEKKGKDSHNPTNYRPISLLPNLGKVFEILINRSINQFSDKENLMPVFQFGFREEHSTLHAATKFSSDICWQLNNGKCVGACFIDLEKAFDTVWLDGLIYKLIKKNFPSHLIKIIYSMIHDKKCIVSNGYNNSSMEFEVRNGLKQGTVNSPVLFNLYTCDLLNLFELNNNPNKKALAFADDLLTYTADKKSISSTK